MGTGIMIVPNGEDDIDLEVCNCKQNENSNRKSKRSVKPKGVYNKERVS